MDSNTLDASMLASWTKGDTTVRGLYKPSRCVDHDDTAGSGRNGAKKRSHGLVVFDWTRFQQDRKIAGSTAQRGGDAPRQLGIAIDLPFAIARIGTRQVCLHDLRPRGAHGRRDLRSQ
jgi:hypothetical protein